VRVPGLRWARTVSNRRPLVCKAALPRFAWSRWVASMSICPSYESHMCRRVHRFTARCCASWHTLGTPGVASPRASKIATAELQVMRDHLPPACSDPFRCPENQNASTRSPAGRNRTREPLGYEPTGRRLTSPPGSQTRRSRGIAWPRHHAAFHAISTVASPFVHKSAHNTNCTKLALQLISSASCR